MNHASCIWRWLPEWAVVMWCLFVGIAVWQNVQRSEQPPVYDAQGYFQKAQNFWKAVDERKWVNPLNLEPTFRPPGTVLMSYPFGFNLDFRGFYFRSIYWPVLLLAIAAYVAVWHWHIGHTVRRDTALTAVFLTSLPAIYQFELGADLVVASYFGLVDNFMMGLATLAVAASLRSIATQRLCWVAVAASLASFCLLVKPAGAYVMALVSANWLLLALVRVRGTSSSAGPPRAGLVWLVAGLAIFAALYAAILAAALTSRYLSAQNLAFGMSAIAVMQSEWAVPLHAWREVLPDILRKSIGYALPMIALVLVSLALLNRRQGKRLSAASDELPATALAVAALASLAFGIWFWLLGSGGLHGVRYFVPFAAMAALYALPLALATLARLPQWQAMLVQGLCLLPVLNIGLLLAQAEPSARWQKWAGVNLASGAPDANLEQARRFVNEVAKGRQSVKLYALRLGRADQAYQAVADYQRAANPATPAIIILRSADWARTSTYRLTEILGADFVLLEPVSDPALKARVLSKPSIDNFDEEQLLFQAWAMDLSSEDGVHVVFAAPSARLLRIDDRPRLEAAIARLEAQHRWRETFLEANPKRWWSENELAGELIAHGEMPENVDFSAQFTVRAMSVRATDAHITLKLWWEQIDPNAGGDWIFFVHALDRNGEMLLNNGIALAYWTPPDAGRQIRFDSLTFRKPPNGLVASLGVGLYRAGDGHILAADSGHRDWNNRRVIVPVR